jgi:hypothetical protein
MSTFSVWLSGANDPPHAQRVAWISGLEIPIKGRKAQPYNKQNNICNNKAALDPGLQGSLKNASDICYLRNAKD